MSIVGDYKESNSNFCSQLLPRLCFVREQNNPIRACLTLLWHW